MSARNIIKSVGLALAATILVICAVSYYGYALAHLHEAVTTRKYDPMAPTPPSIQVGNISGQLEILLAERADANDRLKRYDERLRNGITFYLSVVVVSLFLGLLKSASDGKITTQIRRSPVVAAFVSLFIMTNLTMLLQTQVDVAFALAEAKYIAVFLNPKLREMAALSSDALSWDTWTGDIKSVAIYMRDIAGATWMLIVMSLCLASAPLVSPSVLWHSRYRPIATVVGIFLTALAALALYAQGLIIQASHHFTEVYVRLDSSQIALVSIGAAVSLAAIYGLLAERMGRSVISIGHE